MLILCSFLATVTAKDYVTYEGKKGPGLGKHIVFLSGDEEYRSEESLPQLAKILAVRHGFKCTVLFAIDPATGVIDPNVTTNLPGAEALDSADAIVMLLRYRRYPDEQMKHFVDAYLAGKPIIALRTSTHAFNYPDDSKSIYAHFGSTSKTWPGGFGKQVLGETWVSHHGSHKHEATRGIIEPGAETDPILRGVTDLFGNTDVYTANPPADVKILVRGQVLAGMEPNSPPVEGAKNHPMMPVVWTRFYKNEAGQTNSILCTTMGAATDLENEGLRRLIINGVFAATHLQVPAKADVSYVGDYYPSMYGFDGAKKGVKPAAHELSETSGKLQSRAAKLELKPGDHIALIGNTLADRFQHSGWLETFIYSKFPQHDLVFRNLAVAGDEVETRSRPESFGSPEDWLKKTKTDVVFAFFGFNESFRGRAGLPAFRAALDKFLKETLAGNYSGKGTARVVLFSPIANEKHPDPDVPPPTNNANILDYTRAMAEVAASNQVPFVDLFHPSKELYAQAASRGQPLTIDGLHLSENADRLIADSICAQLFTGVTAGAGLTPPGDAPFAEKLRQAVNEKNAQWHQRYRTIDGYNVYGGRSALAFEPGKGGFIYDRNAPAPKVSNFKVMQEEMSQRDVLTANRDKKVWAVAKGGDLVIDDSNLPEVTKVESNHPGPKADKTFPFLSGEDAIAKMKVPAGMKVNLFASEERFPELVKPVQMTWDTKGRLWVAAWLNYPERTPTSKSGDSLLIFEDTDGDGKADKCTHFVDDLNGPTGFQFYKDGVLLVQAPDVWFARDTDGDDHADTKERILMGLSSADSHHTANSLCLDPCGAIYLSDGVFHHTQVETASGPVRNNDAAIYRYEPRTGTFETYVSYAFANPHGRVFDYWGNDLITDATGNNSYFGPAFSGHIDYPAKHPALHEFWNRPSRPCSGTGLLTSRHFPEEFQGNFLDCNVISFQGIYRVKVSEDGSGLKGETLEPLISSSDPNFRPTAVNVGPDGAIYVCDWQNPIIGHMQHHLRDPNRDHEHGRIYRITYEGRPLDKPLKIAGQSVPALLELLKEPENQVREWAKVELGKHSASEVVPAIRTWAASLDAQDANYQHNLLEALWAQSWQNVLDADLLKRLLHSPEPRARAAAARVLCYSRDRVPDALVLFKALAEDESPRVRLEAVRAASFFRTPEAAEVPFLALNHPTDYYLDYVLHETLHQLEPWWKKEIASNSPLAAQWAQPRFKAARDFVFQTMAGPELLNLPRSPMALETILTRSEVSDTERLNALAALAELRKTNNITVLLQEFDAAAAGQNKKTSLAATVSLSHLLLYQRPDDLKRITPRLIKLIASKNPVVRQNAWAARAYADGDFDTVWDTAAKSPAGLTDLLNGIPLITDPDLRNRGYYRVAPLLVTTGTQTNIPLLRATMSALVSMNEHQAPAFASLSELIGQGIDVAATARYLRMIPRSKWSGPDAARAAKGIVNWVKTVPVADRSTPEMIEAVQVATDLTGLVPPDLAESLRKDLRSVKVSSFVIRTVREQMRYDTPRLVVEAGKPFEIIFENQDFMPHNLVVVAPNTREKVGLAAATMKPEELDAEKRSYIPKVEGILGGSRLLQTGERQILKLIAPEKTGECVYVCTFPGHYQVMWGKLVVTKDVDAYLAANPGSGISKVAAETQADTHGAAGHHHTP